MKFNHPTIIIYLLAAILLVNTWSIFSNRPTSSKDYSYCFLAVNKGRCADYSLWFYLDYNEDEGKFKIPVGQKYEGKYSPFADLGHFLHQGLEESEYEYVDFVSPDYGDCQYIILRRSAKSKAPSINEILSKLHEREVEIERETEAEMRKITGDDQ